MGNPEGFTKEIQEICRDRCEKVGDPPCWLLPELAQPCDHITPCNECLAELTGELK